MSKLSEKVKQKTSVQAISSTAANICEKCSNEVDEELKKVKMKEGRKRVIKEYCNECYADFMGRSSTFTITMPNAVIMWLDEYVKEKKAMGADINASLAVRRGLELLKKSDT